MRVHDLALKARALHVGLEGLIDPRHGFAQRVRVSKDILMPGLFSALCNWPRRLINPCRERVCASSGTVESRTTMPTILRRRARCNALL